MLAYASDCILENFSLLQYLFIQLSPQAMNGAKRRTLPCLEICHPLWKCSVCSGFLLALSELHPRLSASERRCLLQPLPQEDWVPNPGRSSTLRGTHGWRVRQEATPITAQQLTFCMGETGVGVPGAQDAWPVG